jgi:hypothetical protein
MMAKRERRSGKDRRKATRVPVKFNYTGLNFDFIQQMAEIVPYADAKYETFAQYTRSRMTGEASPINHLVEHARQYMMDEPYDHFDGDRGRHLVAIAYNAMIEWFYLKRFGPERHPLQLDYVVASIPKLTDLEFQKELVKMKCSKKIIKRLLAAKRRVEKR